MFLNIVCFGLFITTANLLYCSRKVFEDRWLGQVRDLRAYRYFGHEWIHSGHQPRSYLWQTYLSSKAEEVLEAEIDGNLPNICDGDMDAHWPGVTSSKAFRGFVQKVRDAAAPTFFSEVRRLVTQGLVGDEDTNADADKASLLCTLDELQWCFMQTGVAPIIRISTLKSSRISDLAKLAVEASSQSEWQWWPLQPPSSRGKARGTECRMSWKCVSHLQYRSWATTHKPSRAHNFLFLGLQAHSSLELRYRQRGDSVVRVRISVNASCSCFPPQQRAPGAATKLPKQHQLPGHGNN